ncbi:two-component response regulator ARR22 [Tripterygium wilfordii]|uniref:Two-component response regulator ARR22 n=1 Tax=Tripterygium wilfordii TaxID=458696 RepID=A0A7J7DSA7_TRIWF|nr:two-component response regulator 24-like [Tripterygium wilfordii]KAF5749282.1 two-component response regulator ARR22 [Tripterygium wilfordii]
MVFQKGSGLNLSVLVVDDDAVIRKIHSMLLENLGVEVQVALNGQQAVELHRLGSSFDIVLIDMEMPVMNGPDATKELRKMGVDCLIVGVTSHALSFEKEAFIEAGVNFCFAKPLNVQKLGCILQELSKPHN